MLHNKGTVRVSDAIGDQLCSRASYLKHARFVLQKTYLVAAQQSLRVNTLKPRSYALRQLHQVEAHESSTYSGEDLPRSNRLVTQS